MMDVKYLFLRFCTVLLAVESIAALGTPLSADDLARRPAGSAVTTAAKESTEDGGQAASVERRPTQFQAISALSATSAALAADRSPATHVKFAGQWLTPEEVAGLLDNDPAQADYRERRPKFPDTAEGHFKLAQWCRERGLVDENRAHLQVAAHLAPADRRPQRALGLVQYNGAWMTEAEIEATRNREADALKGYHAWKSRLRGLRVQVTSKDASVRASAESELLAIRDPWAIPAMEEVLSQNNEPLGLLVVRVVSEILHKASTRSLVRHTVWHTSPAVRRAALDQLLRRDPEHYIGDLIHLMRPTRSEETWTTLPNGTTTVVWFMQDFDRNYFTVARVDPHSPSWLLSEGAIDRFRSDRIQRQAASLDAKNQFRMNNAYAALREATGEDFGLDQQAWVNWWQDVSYVRPEEYSNPQRTTVARYETIQVLETHCSCFVAGTPVWTRRGLVPIEEVQLGDLVLTKNVESNELGYEAVIDRTIRRSKATIQLQFDDETIGVTPGHPIWAVGQGWVRARQIEEGGAVATSSGTVPLLATSQGELDSVYNLVVARSNTYFVGKNRILVHDITPVADMNQSPQRLNEVGE